MLFYLGLLEESWRLDDDFVHGATSVMIYLHELAPKVVSSTERKVGVRAYLSCLTILAYLERLSSASWEY